MPKRFRVILWIGLLGWIGGSPLFAQTVGRVEQTESSSNAYYTFVEVGARTVQVQVLGSVASPGLYELTEGTDVGQVLALSGGPVLTPRAPVDKREVYVRVFRPGTSVPIYEADLPATLTDPGAYPAFRDGDVMVVEVVERRGIDWRDIVSIANAVAVFVLALDRIGQ